MLRRRWGGSNSQDVGSEAAIIQRMRNSSLVKPPRADNLPGLKRAAEIAGSVGSVGERRLCGEAGPRGPVERRRARMQALVATGVGIPPAGWPRSPGRGSSSRGQPGPKTRPRGAVDGNAAKIPQPVRVAMTVTGVARQPGRSEEPGGRRAGAGEPKLFPACPRAGREESGRPRVRRRRVHPPGKAASVRARAARTKNGHTWPGREARG